MKFDDFIDNYKMLIFAAKIVKKLCEDSDCFDGSCPFGDNKHCPFEDCEGEFPCHWDFLEEN